ncbi:MAG: 3-deoxy-D-manno-octulosonic acid transferase [Candidatus Sumerlaeota bacterium]|nr:3-deoxy-D-manno-octulosonic acid transferase [Candidatus Sumerlaeota bacterium]
MTFYDFLYYASSPLSFCYFLFKYFFHGKYHESLPAMLGRRLPKAVPGSEFRVPSSTPQVPSSESQTAGSEFRVPSSESQVPSPESRITNHENYPLDFSWNVRRFLDVYRPDVYIMMETELWPNLLTLAGRRGAKIFMLNGRLSDRSFPSYRRFRFIFRKPLSQILACAVQTETDAARMRALCGDRPKIAVTGNCKFDSPAPELTEADKAAFRAQYRLSPGRTIVVAGSTHPGEEEIVLGAWKQVLQECGDATLILAPRHPERFGEAVAIVQRHGLTVSRASAPDRTDPQVLVLDAMGVLARIYGLGAVGIVCGSFASIGGHNVLEAAAHAIPVIYGPHMHKQKELLRILDGEHGGLQVSAGELAPALVGLLKDAARRERIGRLALATVEANRGSAQRSVELILPFIVK